MIFPLNFYLLISFGFTFFIMIIIILIKKDKKWGNFALDLKNENNDKVKHFSVNVLAFLLTYGLNFIIPFVLNKNYGTLYEFNHNYAVLSSLLVCTVISIGREIYDISPLKNPAKVFSFGDLLADSGGILLGFLISLLVNYKFDLNIAPKLRNTSGLTDNLIEDL